MKYLSLLLICSLMAMGAYAQKVTKDRIAVAGGDYTQFSGNIWVSDTKMDSATTDTIQLKVSGGDQTDAIHLWNVLSKNGSNANDSVYVYTYGTTEAENGTHWKLLNTAMTASFAADTVLDYQLIGNNYTNYYTVIQVLSGRIIDAHSEALIR